MSYEYRPLSQETLRRIIRTRAITVNGRVQIDLDPKARWVIIQNVSDAEVYVGNSAVDNTNGFKLSPGDTISFNFLPGFEVYVYANNKEIRIMEVE
jgi:ribosome-associated protein YbcJ (S4-like RNA binding protein)